MDVSLCIRPIPLQRSFIGAAGVDRQASTWPCRRFQLWACLQTLELPHAPIPRLWPSPSAIASPQPSQSLRPPTARPTSPHGHCPSGRQVAPLRGGQGRKCANFSPPPQTSERARRPAAVQARWLLGADRHAWVHSALPGQRRQGDQKPRNPLGPTTLPETRSGRSDEVSLQRPTPPEAQPQLLRGLEHDADYLLSLQDNPATLPKNPQRRIDAPAAQFSPSGPNALAGEPASDPPGPARTGCVALPSGQSGGGGICRCGPGGPLRRQLRPHTWLRRTRRTRQARKG